MSFETRVTWEKLLLEIRHLQPEDSSSLVPVLVGTNSIIWPKENVESCFKKVHYLAFELHQICEKLPEAERWNQLRHFFFQTKGFQILGPQWSDLREEDLLISPVLENRVGHPLTLTLLFMHLAISIDLPVFLVQARQHFILKWMQAGQAVYLDILQNGQVLTDAEIFLILQKSSSNLEVWDARLVYRRYLEELMKLYEKLGQTQLLHTVYNLCLHMDDSNLPILGRRALLRQRLGFAKEALSDLKRYFSFVDRGHAPIELQKAMVDLESVPENPAYDSSGLLH
jgi:regulator of sirC expression with transglutaminase-like and TPR domain